MSETRFDGASRKIKISKLVSALQQADDGNSVKLPIDLITLDENLRSNINKESLEFKQLKASIEESGLLQLPVVTPTDNDILCVGGHRRIEALKELKHTHVKCYIRKLKSKENIVLAQLIENTARENLHPLDMARAIKQIKDHSESKLKALAKNKRAKPKFSATKVAELIGKERKYVEQMLKCANWPEEAITTGLNINLQYKQIVEINAECKEDSEVIAYLLKLISKKSSTNEGSAKKENAIRQGSSVAFRPKNKDKMLKHFADRGLDNQIQQYILDFLKDMRIKGWLPESENGV